MCIRANSITSVNAQVRRWPAWKCSGGPLVRAYPGTPTPLTSINAQVRRWPAWMSESRCIQAHQLPRPYPRCAPPRCAFAPPGNAPAALSSAHIQARQPSHPRPAGKAPCADVRHGGGVPPLLGGPQGSSARGPGRYSALGLPAGVTLSRPLSNPYLTFI